VVNLILLLTTCILVSCSSVNSLIKQNRKLAASSEVALLKCKIASVGVGFVSDEFITVNLNDCTEQETGLNLRPGKYEIFLRTNTNIESFESSIITLASSAVNGNKWIIVGFEFDSLRGYSQENEVPVIREVQKFTLIN